MTFEDAEKEYYKQFGEPMVTEKQDQVNYQRARWFYTIGKYHHAVEQANKLAEAV